MYIYVCIYICIYIYVCVYIYIDMFVYVYEGVLCQPRVARPRLELNDRVGHVLLGPLGLIIVLLFIKAYFANRRSLGLVSSLLIVLGTYY